MNKTQLDRQDVFNLVWDFYAKGGKPGLNETDITCVYFGNDGGQCAWGVVLGHLGINADVIQEESSNDRDAEDVSWDLNVSDRFAEDVRTRNFKFATDLQKIHDQTAESQRVNVDSWKDRILRNLRTFAETYKLDIPGE